MVEIEEALHKLHAREKAKREQDETEAQEEAMEQQVTLPPPFARVDAVTQGSPACGAVSDMSHVFCLAVVSDKLSLVKMLNVAVCIRVFIVIVFWFFFPKGLRVGDEVIEFGSVNTGNFRNLQNIASVVQHSEGVRY